MGSDETDDRYLFELPSDWKAQPREQPTRRLKYPIWTESKAKLIERYLYYFVLITKHGTYIDGFAGPQKKESPSTWAAKLVLESKPRWFRHFHLFEIDPASYKALIDLRDSQPERDKTRREPRRDVKIYFGDFNNRIAEILDPDQIPAKEAAFCLLDQRTFECHWSTVASIASYKSSGHKIELFYFLPNSWMNRAISGLNKRDSVLREWWGREDWEAQILKKQGQIRSEAFVDRFREELGYRSVKAWPIYERQSGGGVMYYMIHATDHPEAPALMNRAYHKAVTPIEPAEQMGLFLERHGRSG